MKKRKRRSKIRRKRTALILFPLIFSGLSENPLNNTPHGATVWCQNTPKLIIIDRITQE